MDLEGTRFSIHSATTFSCSVNQFVGADVLRRVGVGFRTLKKTYMLYNFTGMYGILVLRIRIHWLKIQIQHVSWMPVQIRFQAIDWWPKCKKITAEKIKFCLIKKFQLTYPQCCGSGSRIRRLCDPGSGISDPWSQDHIFKSFLKIFLVKSSIIL